MIRRQAPGHALYIASNQIFKDLRRRKPRSRLKESVSLPASKAVWIKPGQPEGITQTLPENCLSNQGTWKNVSDGGYRDFDAAFRTALIAERSFKATASCCLPQPCA